MFLARKEVDSGREFQVCESREPDGSQTAWVPRLESAPVTTTCSPNVFQVTECVTEAVGRELLQRLLQRQLLMNQKNDQTNKNEHQLQGPGGTKLVHLIAHVTLGTLCSRPHHHSSHCEGGLPRALGRVEIEGPLAEVSPLCLGGGSWGLGGKAKTGSTHGWTLEWMGVLSQGQSSGTNLWALP